MFKSILPTRRVPSTDFTMITSLQDVSNTKENYPSLGVAPQPTSRNMKNTFAGRKASIQLYDKKKRIDTKNNKDQNPPSPVEPVEMNQAFDQLLVSARLGIRLNSSHFRLTRMIYKFHRTSDLNSQAWTLQSRPPCSSRLRSSPSNHEKLPLFFRVLQGVAR